MAIQINKIDAARRQIETAIDLTLGQGDTVSVHTLVCAAREILGDLCVQAGVQGALDEAWERHIRPEKKKEAAALVKRHANFFKHADRDPNAIIDLFEEEANDFLIFWCIDRYSKLGFSWTPRMQWFVTWFFGLNFHLLLPDAPDRDKIEKLAVALKGKPRGFQLMIGRAAYLKHCGPEEDFRHLGEKIAQLYPYEVAKLPLYLPKAKPAEA